MTIIEAIDQEIATARDRLARLERIKADLIGTDLGKTLQLKKGVLVGPAKTTS